MNRPNRIGYQGIQGSNAETASGLFVQRFAMEPATLVPLVTSKDVVHALREGSIDYGVMAVYNKIAGDVAETRDALQTIDYGMVGALAIPIRHCLFKHPDVSIEDVTTIASHPQALLQYGLTLVYEDLKDLPDEIVNETEFLVVRLRG